MVSERRNTFISLKICIRHNLYPVICAVIFNTTNHISYDLPCFLLFSNSQVNVDSRIVRTGVLFMFCIALKKAMRSPNLKLSLWLWIIIHESMNTAKISILFIKPMPNFLDISP